MSDTNADAAAESVSTEGAVAAATADSFDTAAPAETAPELVTAENATETAPDENPPPQFAIHSTRQNIILAGLRHGLDAEAAAANAMAWDDWMMEAPHGPERAVREQMAQSAILSIPAWVEFEAGKARQLAGAVRACIVQVG